MMRGSASRCRDSSDQLRTQVLSGCPVVSGSSILTVDLLGCKVGPPCYWTCASASRKWSIGLISGKFGGQVCTLSCLSFPQAIPKCFVLWQSTLSCWKGGHYHQEIPLPWGTWSTAVFRWVVPVKIACTIDMNARTQGSSKQNTAF